MLVVIGHDGIGADPNDLLTLEVRAALDRDRRVIPVLVDGARMPNTDELPPALGALTRRNAIGLSDMRWDYDAGRREVATARRPAAAPYAESAPEALAPGAAGDQVIDRVLKTRGVNWVAIALAVFSLSVNIVLVITQFTR